MASLEAYNTRQYETAAFFTIGMTEIKCSVYFSCR